jgi:vancomycin resistance protein YoaR
MTSLPNRRKTAPSRVAVASLIGLGLLVVLAVGALFDARSGSGKVQRNVYVAGTNIGKMSKTQFDSFLDELQGRYQTIDVGIVPAQGAFSVSGKELGVTVKRDRLTQRVFQIGHQGGPGKRIGAYFSSFFGKTNLDVPIAVDIAAVSKTVRTKDTVHNEQAIDPKLVVQGDKFVIKPGKPGKGISPAVIFSTLEQRLPAGPVSQTIPVERVELPSRYSDAQLRGLLDKAVALTAKPLPVRVDGKEFTLQPKQLRGLVTPTIQGDEVVLKLDGERAIAAILKGTGAVGSPAKDARLQVNDDTTVSAVPSEVGHKCCAPDTADQLNTALASGTGVIVEIQLEEIQPKITTDQITKLGVKELIGTFTTKHAPGEVRVKNIHHISDLIRGIVIQPGETFSVNKTIGPRTAANGFYKAHVIEDGVFAENFGGGISQFATTMFNASFFAGLDLVEYQSHSLYISRYPFGREATLSFPNPDLKVRNNTPYGVLIWPTYTERSVTISLYSTKYVSGEVVDQVIEKKDQCKIVYTNRLRTYVDGTTKRDKTRAMYRPAEGKDCKGNPTAGATTTVSKTRSTRSGSSKSTAGDSAPETKAPSSKKAPVEAGGENAPETKAKSETTKAKSESSRPKAKDPKPDPKPEPKPEPAPDDGGNVGVGGPPVTGLG